MRWVGEDRLLGLNDIKDLVGGVPERDVFQLLDAMGNKDVSNSISILNFCLENGQEPMAIASMVARQIRIMLVCKSVVDRRMGVDEISAMAKVHRYSFQLCQAQARNFSEDELVNAILSLNEYDVGVKTGKVDPKIGLELMISSISGCGKL
jgi:DNA polymerase-3 subunit delta